MGLTYYFDYIVQYLNQTKLYDNYNNESYKTLSDSEIILESRNALDKIAKKLTYEIIEDAELKDAILKLARARRIIIVFDFILMFEPYELAFILGTKTNSIYVQKSTGLKRLKGLMK